ncbi:MAG: hypothetical protein JXM70_28815 [Pirellulales bacterium]|nr:hypothetical protein [Pirellulales bacterium]
MNNAIRMLSLVFITLSIVADTQAREWTDASGKYKIEATLFAYDDENVVLQRGDKELGIIEFEKLSDKDQEYLRSKEAEAISNKNIKAKQTWTTRSGLKIVGRLVDYAHGDVTIQRRRGRMYVNDRRFSNLPEVYQKLLPKVIEHFDKIKIPNEQALEKWLLGLRGQPRTFSLEGVILESENGDEYAIPFFVFSTQDLKLLKPGWAQWLAVYDDYRRRDDHAFRLEALAAASMQNQRNMQQIATMNLNMQAIQGGLTSAWEVTLYPMSGNPSPPRWVVMPGRNSAQATTAALRQNPGFTAGPVRRVGL